MLETPECSNILLSHSHATYRNSEITLAAELSFRQCTLEKSTAQVDSYGSSVIHVASAKPSEINPE